MDTPCTFLMKKHMNMSKKDDLFNCANAIEPLKCRQCANFETHRLAHLKRHSKAGHTLQDPKEKFYECGRCIFRTHSEYLFMMHQFLNLCTPKAIFVEETGGSVIREKSEPASLTLKWFKCGECDYQTLGSSLLKIHINSRHSLSTEFKCANCTYRGSDASDLERHSMTMHPPQKRTERSCSACFECDGSNADCKHVNVETLKCDHCPFETKFKKSLKDHVGRKHTKLDEIQWFKCAQCPYQTKIKSNLNNHVSQHNQQFRQCDHCWFETKFKSNLREHILRKHLHVSVSRGSQQHVKCEHCAFATKCKRNLRNHIARKHPQTAEAQSLEKRADPAPKRWFGCEHCAYKSQYKANLQRHVFRHRRAADRKVGRRRRKRAVKIEQVE